MCWNYYNDTCHSNKVGRGTYCSRNYCKSHIHHSTDRLTSTWLCYVFGHKRRIYRHCRDTFLTYRLQGKKSHNLTVKNKTMFYTQSVSVTAVRFRKGHRQLGYRKPSKARRRDYTSTVLLKIIKCTSEKTDCFWWWFSGVRERERQHPVAKRK